VTIPPLSAAPPRAYVARTLTQNVMSGLRERYDVVVQSADAPIDAAAIAREALGCQYLFVSVTDRVDAETIAALSPGLRVIATISVGVDHIDLRAAAQHDVRVLHTPDVLSGACAELAWLLILGAARRGYEANRLLRSGTWSGWAPTQLLGRGLAGRRLGILGMGRIGREVAARAPGFVMTVGYHNRHPLDAAHERGATYHETAEALFAASDVVCLCVPGGGATDGMVDRRMLALLPPDAILVNVSRGELIDEDALIEALESGRLFAAGLDVFRGEPAVNPRLAALPNTFLTPHIGSATVDTRDAMGMLLLDGIAAIERGQTPSNQIV